MSLKPLKQVLSTSLKIQEGPRLCRAVCSTAPTPAFFATRLLSSSPTPVDAPRRRWEAPPPRMTAPLRSKPPVEGNEFAVNESQKALDEAYERVLGEGGDKMLTEEVKWLAVTHKSFDHGRRGYNDRLAFLGTLVAPMFQRRSVVDSCEKRKKDP